MEREGDGRGRDGSGESGTMTDTTSFRRPTRPAMQCPRREEETTSQNPARIGQVGTRLSRLPSRDARDPRPGCPSANPGL